MAERGEQDTHCVIDARVGVEDKSNNETVKTQHFGENEDKNLKPSSDVFSVSGK